MFSRRTVLGAATAGLAGCATVSRDASLDQVLDRHARARGGAEALDRIVNTVNVAEIVEPSFTVIGRYIADQRANARRCIL